CIPRSLVTITLTTSPSTSTLSLHDALPISPADRPLGRRGGGRRLAGRDARRGGTRRCPHPRRSGWPGAAAQRGRRCGAGRVAPRSEEHTSELQSRVDLVCRLLLEKKKEDDI